MIRDAAVTALAPMAWGSTYLVTTELLPVGRPLLSGVLRALPAGLLLAVLARRSTEETVRWFPSSRSMWFRGCVLGALNIGAFFALLFAAAYRLPGGIAAAVGAIQPLVALALAAVLLRERPRLVTMMSVCVGIAGVIVLVTRSTAHLDGVGLALAFGGAVSMATGVTLTKHWGRPTSLLIFTSWQLIAGGLLLLPLMVVVEGVPQTFSTRNAFGYLWLATIGTALAYALWFRGIGLLPVVATSVLGGLSPVVAALLGWVVLNQRLTATQGVAALVIILSVVVTQLTANPHSPTTRSKLPQDLPTTCEANHPVASSRSE